MQCHNAKTRVKSQRPMNPPISLPPESLALGGCREGATYRAAHVRQGFLRPLHPVVLHADGEGAHNVTAELHRDTAALGAERKTGGLDEDDLVRVAFTTAAARHFFLVVKWTRSEFGYMSLRSR